MPHPLLAVAATLTLGLFNANALSASTAHWFSDTAPTPELARMLRTSHGGLVMQGRRGGYIKRLYLRDGEDPVSSAYVAHSDATLLLFDPDLRPVDIAFGDGPYADVTFPLAKEGFYNLFLLDRQVRDGLLQVSVVKNETLNHSCRAGHDHVKSSMPPQHPDSIPFDIIRERLPKEDFHTHLSSGDAFVFTVLLHGAPVEGAEVTLVTQEGWRKTLFSDARGQAAFEMIRDYYPPWQEFDRLEMENYLVIASYDDPGEGVHEGQPHSGTHYRVTAAGNYYPSARDYQSYLWGLGVTLFGLLAAAAAIYFHRKRHVTVYREKRLA